MKTTERTTVLETKRHSLTRGLDELVTFTVLGDLVEMQRHSRTGPWDRNHGRSVLTLEQGRRRYAELVAEGYEPW